MDIQIRSEGRMAYGGDQRWFEKKELREVGCGIIACTNLYYALKGKCTHRSGSGGNTWRTHRSGSGGNVYAKASYLRKAKEIGRYMPVLPHLGLDGFRLAAGFTAFCRKEELPYLAVWGMSGRKMYSRMEEMLKHGIPAVLGIGRNFPMVFAGKKLSLYEKRGLKYVEAAHCSGHFVTVYEMGKEWLKVSSWGDVYYINRRELDEYIRRYSNFCFCNILVVEKKLIKS